MVYRVLSIIASILMSLTTLVLVVCLGYTMAIPLFEAGVSGVKSSLNNALDAASEAVGVDLGTAGDWRNKVGDLLGAAVSTVTTASSQGGAYADPTQGQAYESWKSRVGDPVGAVLSGTGITGVVLSGIAGGSGTAENMLTSLDDTALTIVDANAVSYGATVAATEVSSVLPDGVRAQLWEANAAAQSFAGEIQALVAAARLVRAGDVSALAGLASHANAAAGYLDTVNTCMVSAEEALR